MKRLLWPVLCLEVVVLIVISIHLALALAKATKVIHDQREYIEGGCSGRYQGAGS